MENLNLLEALKICEAVLLPLDVTSFESVVCTFIDAYCAVHKRNPAAMINEMAACVELVNNECGPIFE